MDQAFNHRLRPKMTPTFFLPFSTAELEYLEQIRYELHESITLHLNDALALCISALAHDSEAEPTNEDLDVVTESTQHEAMPSKKIDAFQPLDVVLKIGMSPRLHCSLNFSRERSTRCA